LPEFAEQRLHRVATAPAQSSSVLLLSQHRQLVEQAQLLMLQVLVMAAD
jgi:hypothetical protein